MKEVYFKDAYGQKVHIEVSDEVADAYKECRQEEWRNDAYESYYSVSLDGIAAAGHDFADKHADTEQVLLEKAKRLEQRELLIKLKKAMPKLTEAQRATIHKLFVLNMTQAEIAREENVARSTIKERVDGIYAKLRKFLEKN